jgi:hypothetical protein
MLHSAIRRRIEQADRIQGDKRVINQLYV